MGRIIDAQVKDLVAEIEATPNLLQQDPLLETLIAVVQKKCGQIAARPRLQGTTALKRYPIDDEGYALAYDPLEDEDAFCECWESHGFVVGKNVISGALCNSTVQRIRSLLTALSDGRYDLYNPETYGAIPVDHDNIPCISRGFFELYHDNSLAQLRQSVRVYLHHVCIWGCADLWTSFDRYGIKTRDPDNAVGLPLHVDQNPLVHPDFQTTQGVLALVDCPVEQGTFVAVPGSRSLFHSYARGIESHDPSYRGEYVEAGWAPDIHQAVEPFAQPIPLRAGNLVTWDSRTTHGNSPNLTDTPRFVAYVSAGPAAESSPEAMEARSQAFVTGIGKNVRTAMMHASKPPRCNLHHAMAQLREPEKLTYLGKRLYGQESYPSSVEIAV